MQKTPNRSSLPTEKQILEFINHNSRPLGKRDFVRYFRLSTSNRRMLVGLLEDLVKEGKIQRGRNRRYVSNDYLPSVSVVEVKGLDDDGEAILKLSDKHFEKSKEKIFLNSKPVIKPAPGIGDKLLVKLKAKKYGYEARIIKRLQKDPINLIGLFHSQPDCGLVTPSDRRLKTKFIINTKETNGAVDGELVECETISGREFGLPRARIIKIFGNSKNVNAITASIISKHGIPQQFTEPAFLQAQNSKAVPPKNRTDIRHIPLVTIDDKNARDFDDAVWAERTKNNDGWHIIVAIADVSHYVRQNDPLDQAARNRGNSVYFPNTVIPMLPEKLSNGWCSLLPNEDRPCLAVDIWIDDAGNKKRHKFSRCIMRSAARLTYSEVQDSYNQKKEIDSNISFNLISNLYGTFFSLDNHKKKRGAIDLDKQEYHFSLSQEGSIVGIEKRVRLDSHRLIEEFMILANQCAAETLESNNALCMYRTHERPDTISVRDLRKYLKLLGIKFGDGQSVRPRHFCQLIEKTKDRKDALGIQDAILRCQSRAVYSPKNIGHFGLALRRYAHFTSPIRRYSDLLVHRALINSLNTPNREPENDNLETFIEYGSHISMTERRAMAAERELFDRMAALYFWNQEGNTFSGYVTGVERFGLFVEINEVGACGFIPVSTLEVGYHQFDEVRRCLFNERTNTKFQLGDYINVRLKEVNLATGGLMLEVKQKEKNFNTKN